MKSILILCLLLIGFTTHAQNLIPNGSFEEYNLCPTTLEDLEAIGWSSSRGSVDYFNSCHNEIGECQLGVPCNVFGYQEASEGDAYVGFIQFTSPTPEYREQLTCELLEPLTPGIQYFFSMKLNRGNSDFINKASNGQGILLTNEVYDSFDNPSPAFEDFTFVNTDIITDSTSWLTISASFIADEEYSRLVIGAFLESQFLDTLTVGNPVPFGEAYYFLDDLRLSDDSNFVHTSIPNNTLQSNKPFIIFPNPVKNLVTFNQPLQNCTLKIVSLRGEEIKGERINSDIVEYDCSWLSAGHYYLVIESENKIDHLKFIKL